MKTKQQKQEQLEKGKELFKKSAYLVFADFGSLSAEEMRKLRRELKSVASELHVIKKRLLAMLWDKGKENPDLAKHKVPVGTVFSRGGLEEASGSLHRFFKDLKLADEKILGGYDVAAGRFIPAGEVRFLGTLPPRNVLLAQLVGVLASPLKALAYVLDQKSKRSPE